MCATRPIFMWVDVHDGLIINNTSHVYNWPCAILYLLP